MLGWASLYDGNFVDAIADFERARLIATAVVPERESGPWNWRITTPSFASFALWALGYPDRAIEMADEALALARTDIASPADLVSALWWAYAVDIQIGDWTAAPLRTREANQLASEYNLQSLYLPFAIWRGDALYRQGLIEEAFFEIQQFGNELRQSVLAPWFYMALAQLYCASSDASAGLRLIDEGISVGRQIGILVLDAEMHRVKGELLVIKDTGNATDAQSCFLEAIEIARRQSSKAFELRATMSLARLLTKQGGRNEARTMLANIYKWFTEGFDTAGLKDAKMLLDELST